MAYDQLKLGSQLCFRIYTASRLITQAYRPYLEKLGLTYTQYLVMLVLWETDEMLITDIMKKLMLDNATISSLIQRLEAMDLVVRRRGDDDGKKVTVALTSAGRSMEERAKNVPECIVDFISDKSLSYSDLTMLADPLDRIILSLKKHEV